MPARRSMKSSGLLIMVSFYMRVNDSTMNMHVPLVNVVRGCVWSVRSVS